MHSLKSYQILLISGMLMLFAGAVYFHQQAGQGILNAGERCITVILPSLYLFSILASFGVKSGFLEGLAKPFRRLGGNHAVLWMIVIFSQMGGYPVGAQLLHSMYQEGRISAEQEEKLLYSCFGCGFGFLFATVGGNIRTALLLWMMLSLPNLLTAGIFLRRMNLVSDGNPEGKPFAVLLTESVENAASAMLKICGMILAFGAFEGILEGITGRIPAVIGSILEISRLSDYMKSGGSLPMAVGLLSFGGLCVHCQIVAVSENHLRWGRFWLCRILTAVSSGLLCMVSMKFLFPESVPVFLSEMQISAHSSPSAVPACCLAVMSVFVLKKYDFFDKILTNCKK
ncbi:MAG: hypothetical protein IJ644_01125 [Oscillospiraceae bacterium]|nr:hypothetical protein [Oscillospiraceae bacterium]